MGVLESPSPTARGDDRLRVGAADETEVEDERKDLAVALYDVAKAYRGVVAVDGVSLEVPAGQFLAVLGPSGSGKTTMMRLIGGFERPDRGHVELGGKDVSNVPAARRHVNTVFQNYALFPHLSVLDNVAYGPRMRRVARRERRSAARELLELVRLSGVEDRKPHQLSGGMQQRVALARALANHPPVLLLDEPLGALDRKLREDMQHELQRLHGELGTTFIYITHDQDEAFALADRVAVVRAGRLEQVGSPEDVYDAPANAWIARFVGRANAIPGVVEVDGEAVVLHSDVGIVTGSFAAPQLSNGGRALALVRPEATKVAPLGPAAWSLEPNAIAARLVARERIGALHRLVAETPGGLRLEAHHGRDGAPEVEVGDAVRVTFPKTATRLYVEEDGP